MKTFFKVIAIAASIFIGLIIVLTFIFSDSDEDIAAKKAALEKFHCENELKSSKFKNKLINDIGVNPNINRMGMPVSYLLGDYLKKLVKYPSTIQINGSEFNGHVNIARKQKYDLDLKKGTWQYRIPFTSDNKLGMQVKSVMYIDVMYEAGCFPLKVTKVFVE